ncbi:MAG: HIT domain-containing protein [Treponema sp.]|nr:HIT domain-containing protein [Treponema sp.]
MEYFFNFEKLAYVTGKRPDGCILCHVRDETPGVRDTLIRKSLHTGLAVNLYPYNPGHLLLFPLRHVSDIRELSHEERRDIDDSLDMALEALDSLYGPAGYNIGYNMGPAAGASIEHLHLHIIPRYPREIGIAELLAGKRVLLEDIEKTRKKLRETFAAAFSGEARIGPL